MQTHDDIFSSRPIAAILDRFPDIYTKLFKADKQRRQGPIQRGVEESHVTTIWGHTQDVWQAVRVFPWKAYGLSEKDSEEAELLAFFHDLVVETHGKDYTPRDKITAVQKENDERQWKMKFVSSLGPGGECVGDFWETYQAKKTTVAQLVGQIDKLVAVDEAWQLEWSQPIMKPGFPDFSAREFFENVDRYLKNAFLKWVKDKMLERYDAGISPDGVFHELLQSRAQFLREEKQRIDQICALALGPATKEYEANSSPEGLLEYKLELPKESQRPDNITGWSPADPAKANLRRKEQEYLHGIYARTFGPTARISGIANP